MEKRPFWWSYFDPKLSLRLIIIIAFLLITALGNAFGVYDSIVKQDYGAALGPAVAAFVYAIPAYGLFKLKRWARTFVLVQSGALVVLGFILMLTFNIVMGLYIVITHGLIALYLRSRECKEIFGFNL